jgi:DNA-nicking Smr family endonuclease
MEGVRPIPEEERVPLPRPPPATRRPAAVEEESEALARLADLCAGVGPFDWSDTSEYIEGGAPGVDRRLVRRLRRGEFSVQAHLDLHGMTRDEARRAVERFVTTCRQRGLRCVLVIHGRGLNSKDQIPVLKQRLGAWLQRGKLGRQVLAFATARPSDGGTGAIYVLLRK